MVCKQEEEMIEQRFNEPEQRFEEPEQRLDDYLVALVSDPNVRTAFLADRATAIEKANLSKDERGVLEDGRLEKILEYLQPTDPRPTAPEKLPIGSGTGGG
jgi:hypothetical protein